MHTTKQSQTTAYYKRQNAQVPLKKFPAELILQTGFWFCGSCQRITSPVMSEKKIGYCVCVHCDSIKIKFCQHI